MDVKEEYLASCSADGRVIVVGLYARTHDDCILVERPVSAVAISPDFARLQQSKQLLYASELHLIQVQMRKGPSSLLFLLSLFFSSFLLSSFPAFSLLSLFTLTSVFVCVCA